MNETKKKQTFRRRSALLLATILCITAMAGCGKGTQQKGAEKTPTQQSQQALPKTDAENKDKGGENTKDAGKNTSGKKDAGKPAGSQKSTGKPAGSQKSTGKPAGNQKSAGKPAGSQKSTGKPSGGNSSKPTGQAAVPSIKTQPENAKIAAGSSVTFKVSADGANLKYCWQVDKNDGKGWINIPNANESSYTVEKASSEQNGWKFRCVITNSAGNIESAAAILNVDSSAKSK